ncbi:radical SAM protein [Leptotrichia trevisanii]|uniref:radical SAM protein n=1 Tax=Leptotrichia trevisanii TaxID=109328 RepID=UPI0026F0DEB8|nr:radical SAM protein [Leptotrichia trevisanii]
MKVEKIKELYIKKRKLYFASIELTQNCNFKCKHCYCANKKSKNLSLNNHIKIIDKLYSADCLFLNFTGGEIFTYEYFKEIYTYAKNKGFIIDLLTNASLINNNIIELFKKFPPNNIAITIYGANEEDYNNFTGNKNNYKKTMQSLKLLKENNIPFVLRTVVTKTLNESLLQGKFEKIAKEFDTSFKYDPIVFPKTNGETTPLNECLEIDQIIKLDCNFRENSWKKIIQENKRKKFIWNCNAGINSMAIDFQGNAFICGLYRNEPISILENSIEKVLLHLKKIHQRHLNIVENNHCSNCYNRKICKWCPAYSYIYNNNETDKIDFFCKLSQERMKVFGK